MLEWYALLIDFNSGNLEKVNVFCKDDVTEIKKLRRNGKIQNRLDLKIWLKSRFMRQYWSRTEYEMIVSPWPKTSVDNDIKIDVWNQLEPNLDRITDYVISTLGFRFKK